jgi:hypothetical protein
MANAPFSYPRNLSYGLAHIAGYHRNSFRIETVSATSVGAGRKITVNLPENAIIDLRSFRWVINNALGGATATSRQVFPFVQALIQRLEVSCNGMAISPGYNEYNTAFRLMRNARVPQSKSLSVDAALQNQTLDTTTTPTTQQNIYMVCQDWAGTIFGGDCSTRFIDTGKMGVITVSLTLADDAVLPTVGSMSISSPSSGTYLLDGFYFTIDCISLSDGMYDHLLSSMIAKDGYVPISWNELTTFQQDNLTGTTQNQVRFAISSQSVNKIYATLRPSDYTSRGQAASAIQGGTFIEAYQPYFFNFKNFANTSTTAPFRWQFTINNAAHPQYLATEIEGLSQLVICENKVFMDSPGCQIGSLSEYRNNKFVVAIRLNHPIDGETKNKYLSGYDTRGVNSQIVWTFQNMPNAPTQYSAFITVETTSTLKVGAGRQLQLIQ